CEGASLSETNVYAGTAQTLLRTGGIPAVIAMQFKITDRAAIAFTGGFYGALARGYPIDAALAEARKTISSVREDDTEWATPVLYMRSPDGDIFDDHPIPPPTFPAMLPDGVQPPSSPAPQPTAPAVPKSHFQDVVNALAEGQLTPFLGMDINLYGRKLIEQWDPEQGQDHLLPGCSELAAWLAKIYEYPTGETMSLTVVSQYAAVTRKVGALYSELDKVFRADYQPTPLHHFFARLPVILDQKKYPRGDDDLRKRFLIVTMNYDDMLEQAFSHHLLDFHVIAYVAEGSQRGKFLHFKYLRGQLEDPPITIDNGNSYRGLKGNNA